MIPLFQHSNILRLRRMSEANNSDFKQSPNGKKPYSHINCNKKVPLSQEFLEEMVRMIEKMKADQEKAFPVVNAFDLARDGHD